MSTEDRAIDVEALARFAGFDVEQGGIYGRVVNYGDPADQTRELRAFAAAVLEEAAKICDARYMGANIREDLESTRCAAAIRAEAAKLKRATSPDA